MKRIKFCLVLVFASLICGCEVYYGDVIFTYRINNTTEETILLYTEATSQDMHVLSSGEIPMGATIYPLMQNKWIDGKNTGENIYADENFTYTFHFGNGVKHTFSGELISNDFRDVNSWQVEYTSEHDGNLPHIIYTYTFTDEDYERIMALYEE